MTDFIAKKREMFLVQMSLDTKREEIQKLERKAHLKEEALKKSELLLEEVRAVSYLCGTLLSTLYGVLPSLHRWLELLLLLLGTLSLG